MKTGVVALIGRPSVGKSTLVNNLIGQKVAITSPKPQTTRFPIQALYEDGRGQIIFVDTPGIFRKAKDALAKKINKRAIQVIRSEVNLILYLVDHTRKRDFDESRVLGLVRKLKQPKILVVNKIDIKEPTYLPQFKFLEEEFDHVFQISALSKKNLKPLLDKIFELLPEGKSIVDSDKYIYPAINIDSKTFISEIIREKFFLKTRKDVPYSAMVVVDEIAERDKNLTYIKARILTTADKYKKMIIGKGGKMIKEIGSMARKELELATQRKIFLDLTVETDRHWIERLS